MKQDVFDILLYLFENYMYDDGELRARPGVIAQRVAGCRLPQPGDRQGVRLARRSGRDPRTRCRECGAPAVDPRLLVVGECKVPSTVIGGDLVFTAGGWGGRESIKAFRLGGRGELGTNNLVWERKGLMPKIPSMLHVEGLLFAITEVGTACCLKAETGEVLWKERVPGNFGASPVYAEGRVYFVADNGEATVIQAKPEFKILARNPLGEKVQASPAISQGKIIIRSEKHLFAIGAK